MANEKPLKINGTTGKVQRFESGDYVVVGNGGTGLTTVPANAILYASALDVLAALAAGSEGDVLTIVGGVPSWSAPSASGGGGLLLAPGPGPLFIGHPITATVPGNWQGY